MWGCSLPSGCSPWRAGPGSALDVAAEPLVPLVPLVTSHWNITTDRDGLSLREPRTAVGTARHRWTRSVRELACRGPGGAGSACEHGSVPAWPTVSSSARAATRFGYFVGALVNIALAYLVNQWPGWQSVPFLTQDAAEVVKLVNLSLVAGMLVNLVYVVADPAWLKALGNVITTGIGLAVLVRMLRVFPFDFSGAELDWEPWVRIGLIVLIVLTTLALLGTIVQLLRALLGPGPSRPDST